jgi:hypothetical protein
VALLKKTSAFVPRLLCALAALMGIVLCSFSASASYASTVISTDFNTPGQLAADFNSYESTGTISQSANGGISDTGAINALPGTANGIFATKTSFSMGPVGSSYTFVSYLKNGGGSGYGGMGFTSVAPSAGQVAVGLFRPSDGLGVAVHGGGFLFYNGGSQFASNWTGLGQDPAITAVKTTTESVFLNSASPDKWFKVELLISRRSLTTMDMRVSLWPCSSAGVLISADPDVIFELNNQATPDLLAAPAFQAFMNFSGNRIYYFDDFSVNLAGGATVVGEGAPVVLTTTATPLAMWGPAKVA